jgi:hypothetical protein
MEIVKRANLKNRNDVLGMLLELATVEALKSIPLYVLKTSQFNEFYQADRSVGPDILFEFGEKKIGAIECKNLNEDFRVNEKWFKNSVEKRFFPMYKDIALSVVIISRFLTSPPELASKLRRKYRILSLGFQIVDEATYYDAIPIIAKDLLIVTEWLNRDPRGLKKENTAC